MLLAYGMIVRVVVCRSAIALVHQRFRNLWVLTGSCVLHLMPGTPATNRDAGALKAPSAH